MAGRVLSTVKHAARDFRPLVVQLAAIEHLAVRRRARHRARPSTSSPTDRARFQVVERFCSFLISSRSSWDRPASTYALPCGPPLLARLLAILGLAGLLLRVAQGVDLGLELADLLLPGRLAGDLRGVALIGCGTADSVSSRSIAGRLLARRDAGVGLRAVKDAGQRVIIRRSGSGRTCDRGSGHRRRSGPGTPGW